MAKLDRMEMINGEYLDVYEEEFEYDGSSENLVTKHIFEIKDAISYEILKQELIDTLEIDNRPLFLEGNARNIVRIISENIDNLVITDPDDKMYLNTFREEIRQLVLGHMEDSYSITYNINEADDFIDLEPVADLYEFFILRKLKNIFKYYYSIISMKFFDINVTDEERPEMVKNLREYLISINEKLIDEEDLKDSDITMQILGEFFNNKYNIVNSGIINIVGFSSFLNFVLTADDGEMVSDRVREMFYNFGGFKGIEFDDAISFKNYFDCLIELENANELLVLLASKVFQDQNQ